MREIGDLLEQPPNLRDLGDPGLDAAYDAWSETYDELPNLLIDAEEPLVRSLLEGLEGQVALNAAAAGEPPTHTSRRPTSGICRCDPRAWTSPCAASR